MKKCYFLFLLFNGFIFAQNGQAVDSVLYHFQTKKDANPDEALKYLEKGFQNASEPDKLKKQATYLAKMIHIFGLKHDINEANKRYETALKFAEDNNNVGQMVASNIELGEANRKSNKLNDALKFFSKAYDICISKNHKKGIVSCKNNLSITYLQKGDFKNALKEILIAFENVEDDNLIGKTVLSGNITNLYNKTNNKKKSEEFARKGIFYGLKIKDAPEYVMSSYVGLVNNLHDRKAFPEAQKVINEIEHYIKIKKLDFYKFYLLELKASQLIFLGKPDEARPIILKAIQVAKANGQTEEDLIEIKSKLVKIDAKNGKSENSIATLDSLLVIAKKENRLKDLADTYGNLVVAYKKVNNIPKAFEAQENYILYNDSIVGMSQQKFYKDAEVKYETAQKEQLLTQNKYKLLQKETENKRKNFQILALIIGLLFTGLLGLLFYKNQKTKNKQQKQEAALKETLLKIEAENQLQEQRLGISKELHDNIGSQLTFVISSIDTLKQNYPSTNEKIDSQLENINAFTKNTITELRDTVWVMNTKELNGNALKERLLENMERAKMTYENINFKVDIADFDIDNSVVALNLFRTIQEATNNALKYANASEIEISIHEKNNQIQAFVKDNGLGFDPETIKKGNGLKNMKKRIQSVGGSFDLASQEKTGTQIAISIPKNL